MIALEVVDNFDQGIDPQVDNLEVNTSTGVDLDLEVAILEVDTHGVDTLEVAILEVAILEVDIDTEVDFGVHIEAGVDTLGVDTLGVDTLEVTPQTRMKYLEVAPQALTKVAPQAVIGHLEVG